jgi:hypothetical protein
MEGHIKIYRQLLESSVFASEKRLKIWIWLLCKANFKQRFIPISTGKGDTVVNIERGQLLFGRFKAEEELGIDGCTVYKNLKWFEAEDMIKIESNNHYSVITICNYDNYQGNNINEITPNEQPSNNEVTTKSQPSNTPKKDKKDKNEKNVLMKNSPAFDLNYLIQNIGNDYQKYDLKYYHESLLNWSDSKGAKKIDWLATVRNAILRDEKENKAKFKISSNIYR